MAFWNQVFTIYSYKYILFIFYQSTILSWKCTLKVLPYIFIDWYDMLVLFCIVVQQTGWRECAEVQSDSENIDNKRSTDGY